MKTVLVVGATGRLGGLIARALHAKNAKLRLLVRTESRAKLPDELVRACDVVDLGATAFRDMHTVVSAVQGGPDTIIDA